jgi:hypothetical protein
LPDDAANPLFVDGRKRSRHYDRMSARKISADYLSICARKRDANGTELSVGVAARGRTALAVVLGVLALVIAALCWPR